MTDHQPKLPNPNDPRLANYPNGSFVPFDSKTGRILHDADHQPICPQCHALLPPVVETEDAEARACGCGYSAIGFKSQPISDAELDEWEQSYPGYATESHATICRLIAECRRLKGIVDSFVGTDEICFGAAIKAKADRWQPTFLLKYEPEHISDEATQNLIAMMQQDIAELQALSILSESNEQEYEATPDSESAEVKL